MPKGIQLLELHMAVYIYNIACAYGGARRLKIQLMTGHLHHEKKKTQKRRITAHEELGWWRNHVVASFVPFPEASHSEASHQGEGPISKLSTHAHKI